MLQVGQTDGNNIYLLVSNFGNDSVVFSSIKHFTSELIDFFFKNGALQQLPNELPDQKFPIDPEGRSFHKNRYWKKLPNCDVFRRKW